MRRHANRTWSWLASVIIAMSLASVPSLVGAWTTTTTSPQGSPDPGSMTSDLQASGSLASGAKAPGSGSQAPASGSQEPASPPASTTPLVSPAAPDEPLAIGERWRGRVAEGSSTRLGLTVAAPQHLGIRVVQPKGSDLEVSLASAGRELLRQRAPKPGAPLELELWLQAGDHVLTLHANEPSDGRVRVRVLRLDPFDVPADTEPNDDPELAHEVPPSLRWEGGPAGAEPDLDGFWLPPLTAPGDVRVTITGEPPLIRLFADAAREERVDLDDAGEGLLVAEDVPTDRPLYLEVEAEGPYGLELEAPGWTPADEVLAPPVELELRVDEPEGVTCPTEGGSIPASLTVIDAGAEAVELELRTATSDPAWQLHPDVSRLELASGESTTVPVSVDVAAGPCPDGEVALSLAAVTPDGGLVSTTLTLDPAT